MHRVRIIPMAFGLACAVAVQAQNLLSNPGFENANPGDYWQLWKADTAAAAEAALSFPDTGAHEGTRYARVEVKTPAAENWHIQLQLPPDWTVDSGATYELKFWAKSDSSTSIHVGIQDGPDNNYTYRSGQDFQLAPEWAEHTLVYASDRQGSGALRFNLYLGRFPDAYGFDGFSLLKETTGLRDVARSGRASAAGERDLRIRQEGANLVVSPGTGLPGDWKAELLDLRGRSVAVATGRAGDPLILARPRESGIYLVRAVTPSRSRVRMAFIGQTPHP